MARSSAHDISRGKRAGQACLQAGPERPHADDLALPVFCRSTSWTIREQQDSLTGNWDFAFDHASDTCVVAGRLVREETLRAHVRADAARTASALRSAASLCSRPRL